MATGVATWGRCAGGSEAAIQALCLRSRRLQLHFSRMVEERLPLRGYAGAGGSADRGVRRAPDAGGGGPAGPVDPPLVVFAGRHIPEKRVLTIPPAIAAAGAASRPALRDPRRRARYRGAGKLDLAHSLEDVIEIRGRVEAEEVRTTIVSASCLLNLSAKLFLTPFKRCKITRLLRECCMPIRGMRS